MKTECSQLAFEFQALGARQVVADFTGGTITSDAGGLLLREVETRTGLLAKFAKCFDDYRDGEKIEHSVADLLKQRIFALALGYEDLNDHEHLRADPLLATLVGKRDVTGAERVDPRDRGKPLAGKSTLNRLELTPARASIKSRYKKIVARQDKLAAWFVDAYLQLNPEPPEEIVLDLDAPMIQFTANRRAGSFTATTKVIATCRSISSAASTCCSRSCGRRTSTRPRVARSKWRGSSRKFARNGRTCESSCVATAVSVATI